jgi:hypothetical protein
MINKKNISDAVSIDQMVMFWRSEVENLKMSFLLLSDSELENAFFEYYFLKSLIFFYERGDFN